MHISIELLIIIDPYQLTFILLLCLLSLLLLFFLHLEHRQGIEYECHKYHEIAKELYTPYACFYIHRARRRNACISTHTYADIFFLLSVLFPRADVYNSEEEEEEKPPVDEDEFSLFFSFSFCCTKHKEEFYFQTLHDVVIVVVVVVARTMCMYIFFSFQLLLLPLP